MFFFIFPYRLLRVAIVAVREKVLCELFVLWFWSFVLILRSTNDVSTTPESSEEIDFNQFSSQEIRDSQEMTSEFGVTKTHQLVEIHETARRIKEETDERRIASIIHCSFNDRK